MSEAIECKRELIVDKSADEVWQWISNVRNIMTANQFHVKFIPATLENDLRDVAFAIGAIDRKTFVNPPAAYFRLVGIREMDGKPAGEVLDLAQSLFKQPS